MKVNWRFFVSAFALFAVSGAMIFSAPHIRRISAQSSAQKSFNQREEAYRANNFGVAQLEQFNHKEGAEAFRRALALDPKLEIARVNLAIALFNLQDIEAARAEAANGGEKFARTPAAGLHSRLDCQKPKPHRRCRRAFRRVLEIDAEDVGANVNLGQIYAQQRKYAEAIAAFRRAIVAEPYNSTALYNLATALLRNDARAEGQQLMTRFQALRQSGAATSIGQNYLEQGRYAEAIVSTGAEKGFG
jgi:cytochrome c-type biogenesis protein CcmH/NrfG